MRRDWLKLLALLLPVLTGCLSHTRKLQQPELAGVVMNADAIELVEAINKRYDEINSLTATVDFAASVGGAHTGKQTDYTSFHGFILFRKPKMLRVIGEVPVIRTIAFNLASNGDTFTLLIPHYSKAIQGELFGDHPGGESDGEFTPQHLPRFHRDSKDYSRPDCLAHQFQLDHRRAADQATD